MVGRIPARAHSLASPLLACCGRIPHRGVSSSRVVSAAELQFGQPVHETHPHILQPAEITVGITAQEYEQRRAALAQRLPPGGVAVLAAAPLMYRSGAVFYPYRQDSNFLYLTGFNESDAVAVIQKTGDSWGDYIFRLFVQPKDPAAEQWSGPRTGIQAAMDVFNADEADDIRHADARLADIATSAGHAVYADLDRPVPGKPTGRLWHLLGAALRDPAASRPLAPLLDSLRVVKSAGEIANMRRAGQLSGRVMTDAMRRPWTRERDLHSFLDHGFIRSGLDGSAYVPVVAGADRARIIHYVHNNDVLHDGSLVLVDAGGECGTYITDISRTWPVSGRFTAPQRHLYEAVLRVQRRGVSLCRQNSAMSLEDIHRATVKELSSGLAELGFDIAAHAIHELFPHHVGHYIGLDVHDTPGYSRSEPLRTGHCVTIEPGVYIPDDDRWPAHFRGLGIRIEDSVCVGDDTPLILTTEAVKEVADIEALRD